jgi:hypothetical protein
VVILNASNSNERRLRRVVLSLIFRRTTVNLKSMTRLQGPPESTIFLADLKTFCHLMAIILLMIAVETTSRAFFHREFFDGIIKFPRHLHHGWPHIRKDPLLYQLFYLLELVETRAGISEEILEVISESNI